LTVLKTISTRCLTRPSSVPAMMTLVMNTPSMTIVK